MHVMPSNKFQVQYRLGSRTHVILIWPSVLSLLFIFSFLKSLSEAFQTNLHKLVMSNLRICLEYVLEQTVSPVKAHGPLEARFWLSRCAHLIEVASIWLRADVLFTWNASPPHSDCMYGHVSHAHAPCLMLHTITETVVIQWNQQWLGQKQLWLKQLCAIPSKVFFWSSVYVL